MITVTEGLHIIPIGDLREHEPSIGCWCRPTEDDETDDLWIHHALDQRERYENGEDLLPH